MDIFDATVLATWIKYERTLRRRSRSYDDVCTLVCNAFAFAAVSSRILDAAVIACSMANFFDAGIGSGSGMIKCPGCVFAF